MKLEHTAIVVIAVLFAVPGATAVVGGPEPGDGEMAITSHGSSSASASTSVGENGTEWKAETSMINRTGNITDQRLEDISYSGDEYKVEFVGHIEAPTPCHVINHEVDKLEDGYVLNVQTKHDQLDKDSNESGQMCAQQLTMIKYDGEFSAEEDFTVEVRHNNETVETLDHPGIDEEPEPAPEPRTGFFGSLRSFFSGLF